MLKGKERYWWNYLKCLCKVRKLFSGDWVFYFFFLLIYFVIVLLNYIIFWCGKYGNFVNDIIYLFISFDWNKFYKFVLIY